MDIKESIQVLFAAACTLFSYLLGALDAPLMVLLTFMVFDYLTGLMCGVESKTLSSAVGFKGILKKVSILLILSIGVMLDNLISGGQPLFKTMICYFYISNEGISILENISKLGVPLPAKLMQTLEQIQEKEDAI